MAEAKQKDEWNRAASIICHVVNVQLPKGKRLNIHDVHPFHIQPVAIKAPKKMIEKHLMKMGMRKIKRT